MCDWMGFRDKKVVLNVLMTSVAGNCKKRLLLSHERWDSLIPCKWHSQRLWQHSSYVFWSDLELTLRLTFNLFLLNFFGGTSAILLISMVCRVSWSPLTCLTLVSHCSHCTPYGFTLSTSRFLPFRPPSSSSKGWRQKCVQSVQMTLKSFY
jgi:hypothetical protein